MGELIQCTVCYREISEYYHPKYRGLRGRCPGCGIDFPLE